MTAFTLQYFQLDEFDDAEQYEEDTDDTLEQLDDIGSPSVQFNVLSQQDSEIQKELESNAGAVTSQKPLPRAQFYNLSMEQISKILCECLETRGYPVQLLEVCMTIGEDLTGFNSAMSDDEILSLFCTILSKSYSICHEYAEDQVCTTFVGLLICVL